MPGCPSSPASLIIVCSLQARLCRYRHQMLLVDLPVLQRSLPRQAASCIFSPALRSDRCSKPRGLRLRALPSIAVDSSRWLPPLLELRSICFDASCQAEVDRAFVLALGLPLVALAAGLAYLLRPLPDSVKSRDDIFEDPQTGYIFEAAPGAAPERDRRGELAFRAVGFTPWPVEQGAPGERLRLAVGPVGDLTLRSFVFEKVLPPPSQLVTVTLPRPLGIVFEDDARRGRVVVAELAAGGAAERAAKAAALDGRLWASAPRPGDVLRAATCTNLVFPTGALLFGAQRPQRSIVVFGADGQRWPVVAGALREGLVADGDVTLVLERKLPRGEGPAAEQRAAPAPDEARG